MQPGWRNCLRWIVRVSERDCDWSAFTKTMRRILACSAVSALAIPQPRIAYNASANVSSRYWTVDRCGKYLRVPIQYCFRNRWMHLAVNCQKPILDARMLPSQFVLGRHPLFSHKKTFEPSAKSRTSRFGIITPKKRCKADSVTHVTL